MKTVMKRWGDSFVIRMPDVFSDKLKLWEKTYIELSVENDRIIIEPVANSQYVSVPPSENIKNNLDNDRDSEEAYPDITQSGTWKLCGSLEIEAPDPRYIVEHNDSGQIITNYAEHVDEVMADNTHV